MLDFKTIKDPKTKEEWIETSLTGKVLLSIPQLNKGTAFTESERHAFGLLGKLPAQVETLEEQVQRALLQYQAYADSPLQQHIYLNNLHDKNQVLFYKLVTGNLAALLPLIYTPVVGTAVKEYSREYRQARGLYIAYPYHDRIAEILDNRSHPEIDLIVVTDGERILGIGDQGVGGMDIPIAKLMVYTLCAGINPLRTLPIMIDVGTNNPKLLNDPLYLGLRHKRITGKNYDDFIAKFVMTVKEKFPHVFLHWEDFGRDHARYNLERYRDKICSFNDDIQGTAAVALAALLAAVRATKTNLKDQNIVIFGAGTAGTGIADQIHTALIQEGLTAEEAYQHFWLIDQAGLIHCNLPNLTSAQLPYARNPAVLADWPIDFAHGINLLDVIRQIKPTVLIGCSAQAGAFTQSMVEEMAKHCDRPIIFPLSNPTECSEANPEDLIHWTQGRALIATGSPFPNVNYKGRNIPITQCNNALVFPGIGLGVLAAKASYLSDRMLWVACHILSEHAPILQDPTAPLLPEIAKARSIAYKIAMAVATQARHEGYAQINEHENIAERIEVLTWHPHYIPFRKPSFSTNL